MRYRFYSVRRRVAGALFQVLAWGTVLAARPAFPGVDAAEDDSRLEELASPEAEAMLDGKPLLMTLAMPHGYVPKKMLEESYWTDDRHYPGFIRVTYGVERIGTSEFREGPIAGYFEVAGQPEKVKYASSNAKVVRIVETTADFVGAGTAEISCEVAGTKLSIPFHVYKLPIEDSEPIDRHVKILGLPDHKTHVAGSWPAVITRDDVTYVPEPGDTVFRDHWRYTGFPGVVFTTTGDNVIDIRCNRWKIKGGPDTPTPIRGTDVEPAPVEGAAEAQEADSKAAERELRLARLLLKNGKKGPAVERLRRIMRLYPASDAAEEAKRLID